MIRVSVIGLWNSFYFPNQLEVNPKNIANTKPICVYGARGVFPRLAPVTLYRPVYVSGSDWFTGLITSAVIGQLNYFGFGFTALS